MYGLVNRAIEDLIVGRHGQETWTRIAAAAQFEHPTFLSMEQYPDELTYRLVQAASTELGAASEDLLEAFGEFWIRYTADEGYGDLLEISGSTLEEFLGNLDAMHVRVGFSLPDLRPPSFTFEQDPDGSGRDILHYRSHRAGLAPMVRGLLRGLGRRFGVELEVEHVPPDQQTAHDRFLIRRSPP